MIVSWSGGVVAVEMERRKTLKRRKNREILLRGFLQGRRKRTV